MHTHRENIKTTVKGCSIPLELRYQLAEAKPPTFLFWLLGFNLGPHPSMLNFTHWELPVMDFSLQCPGFTFTHSLLPPDIFLPPSQLFFISFPSGLSFLFSLAPAWRWHHTQALAHQEKKKQNVWHVLKCPHSEPTSSGDGTKYLISISTICWSFTGWEKKILNLRLTTQQMLFSLSSLSTEKQTWRPICISRNKSIKWA